MYTGKSRQVQRTTSSERGASSVNVLRCIVELEMVFVNAMRS